MGNVGFRSLTIESQFFGGVRNSDGVPLVHCVRLVDDAHWVSVWLGFWLVFVIWDCDVVVVVGQFLADDVGPVSRPPGVGESVIVVDPSAKTVPVNCLGAFSSFHRSCCGPMGEMVGECLAVSSAWSLSNGPPKSMLSFWIFV